METSSNVEVRSMESSLSSTLSSPELQLETELWRAEDGVSDDEGLGDLRKQKEGMDDYGTEAKEGGGAKEEVSFEEMIENNYKIQRKVADEALEKLENMRRLCPEIWVRIGGNAGVVSRVQGGEHHEGVGVQRTVGADDQVLAGTDAGGTHGGVYLPIGTQGGRQNGAEGKEKTNSFFELMSDVGAIGNGLPLAKRSYAAVVTNAVVTNAEKENIRYDNSNSSRPSDLKLKYFTSSEGPVVLTAEKEMLERLNKCVVGYFLGGRLGFFDVEVEIKRQWPRLKTMKRNEKGFYLFDFQDTEDVKEVIEKGHCYVFGRIMVLKQWQPMLNLSKEAVNLIPVWVRFMDLPLEFWTCDNLSRLASKIGRPLHTDKATEELSMVDFARICIEIDASKSPPKSVQVTYEDTILEVELRYQWLPQRCEECKAFGHKTNLCPKRKNQVRITNRRENPGMHKWQPIGCINGKGEKGKEIEEVGEGIPHNPWEMKGNKSPKTKFKDRLGNVVSGEEMRKRSVGAREPAKGNAYEILCNLDEEFFRESEKVEASAKKEEHEVGGSKRNVQDTEAVSATIVTMKNIEDRLKGFKKSEIGSREINPDKENENQCGRLGLMSGAKKEWKRTDFPPEWSNSQRKKAAKAANLAGVVKVDEPP